MIVGDLLTLVGVKPVHSEAMVDALREEAQVQTKSKNP
jgi:hypothetical protein